MQLAHRSAAAAPRCVPRCPAQRPSLRVRSASPAVNLTAEVEQAADTQTHVVALTGAEYEAFIAANEAVLIDYYTDWCGPCKMIAPHLEEMAAEMTGIKFAKLNCTTDAAAKKIAMAQGVKALPTFHFFRKNERVGVFVGGKPAALRKFLTEQLA